MQINYALAFAGQTSERGLSGDLSAPSQSLTGPSALDAVSEPLLGLNLALANASLQISGLAQEQARLRDSLEKLNSTLLINKDPQAGKAGAAAVGQPDSDQKDQAVTDDSFAVKYAKEVRDSLWDTVKTRFSGNVVDAVADKLPNGIGKLFKDEKGDKDCCCPGENQPLSGRDRFAPNSSSGSKKASKKKPLKGAPAPKPGKRAGGFGASLRSLFERGTQASGSSRMGFASVAPSRAPEPAPSLPKAPVNNLVGPMARLESGVARRLAPLRMAEASIDVIQGVRNGDMRAVGSGLATAGGGWAGAAAGAALGTLVLPGVGTAIGGVVGGMLGSEAGSWLSEKLFGSEDRLPSPDTVSKAFNSASADNLQITIAPSIQISGVNLADAQPIIDGVIQALHHQTVPTLTNALSVRRNAALIDLGGYA